MIRPVREKDQDAVAALIFGVLREYDLKSDPESTDADLGDIVGFYGNRRGMFDVLEIDGRIVGAVGLVPMDDGRCELRKMYLVRSFRGRGLGTRLLKHALDRALQMGFSAVVLETAFVLKEAIALYTKHGFEPIAGHRIAGRCDQAFIKYLDEDARPP